jgi:hypothetical protein
MTEKNKTFKRLTLDNHKLKKQILPLQICRASLQRAALLGVVLHHREALQNFDKSRKETHRCHARLAGAVSTRLIWTGNTKGGSIMYH